MALGRFPIPKLSDAEIEEEMKLPAAGSVPPRPKKNSAATEADKNVPIFAMLVHVVEDVRILLICTHCFDSVPLLWSIICVCFYPGTSSIT